MREENSQITIDVTDDMYVGCLPCECIEDFVCMLCYGIVIDPIKCTTCETHPLLQELLPYVKKDEVRQESKTRILVL